VRCLATVVGVPEYHHFTHERKIKIAENFQKYRNTRLIGSRTIDWWYLKTLISSESEVVAEKPVFWRMILFFAAKRNCEHDRKAEGKNRGLYSETSS